MITCLALACGDSGSSDGNGDADGSTSTSGPTTTLTASSTSSSATATTAPTMTATGVDESSSSESTGGIGLEGEWVTLAPLALGPRQETGVVAHGGLIYVIGGFMGVEIVDVVEVYDPASDSWDVVAPVPEPLHHANTASAGGGIVVAGFQTAGFQGQGEVYFYDPGDGAWTERTPMPAGTERGASGVAAIGELVYVVGGDSGGASSTDAWTYDVADDIWAPIAELPAARNHLTAVAHQGRVYAIGGRDGGLTGHTTRVDEYDPDADAWTEIAGLPTSRAGIAGARAGGFAFVAGGEGNEGEASGVFEEFEAYDFAAGEWATLPPMPTPRHGTGAAALDGIIYVPGGATTQGLGAVDTFEAWVPAG